MTAPYRMAHRALAAVVLAGCAVRGAPVEVLRGSVTHRERSALPPDAMIHVRLSDVSRLDAAAPLIAETTFASAGRQVPIPFALSYDPRRIQANHTYAVRATIRSGGRMIFTTDQAYHAITAGHPTRVDLTLVGVRDVPGAAKTGTAPATRLRTLPSQSGVLTGVGGKLRFVACGQEGDGVSIEDLPDGEGQAVVRELGGGGRVVVMIRLDGNRLTEIRYAGGEGPGCDGLPPEGDVEARGNEPFWHLRVDGARATVTTPEAPNGVVYDGGRWLPPSGGPRRYEARREQGGRVDLLTLELTETRCTDSMSGARYPFAAVVHIGEKRLEGCGLEGAPAPP